MSSKGLQDHLDEGMGQSEGGIKLNVESIKLAREDSGSGSDQYLKRCC